MISRPVPRCLTRRRPWRAVARLCVEALEARAVPSLVPWPGLNDPFIAAEADDTAGAGHDLGLLGPAQPGEAVGTIGDNGSDADVDWFSFSLENAARVVLSTLNELAGTSMVSVLSLYNEDADSYLDPQNPVGKRLLAQADGADSAQPDARIVRNLSAGTYHVAVSGSGNRYFHPHLADSGLPGSTGAYGLLITVSEAEGMDGRPVDLAAGPSVLTLDPEADGIASQSPFVVRATFSEGLDPSTLPADPLTDNWVQLIRNPTATFGDGNDEVVPLATVNFSTAVNELQLVPQRALGAGFYQVFLAGDSLTWATVLRDFDGNPLGMTVDTPDGQDFTAGFQIDGAEGVPGEAPPADDAPGAEHDLGALAQDQFVQARGAVGDDPAYDPTLENPFLFDPTAQIDPPYLWNPAADVDLYEFQVPEGGPYLFLAEAFAGRIGSPLDPALSLYSRATPGAPLTLVAANDSTLNRTQGTDFSLPLFADAALFVSLNAGEYVLAVSSSGNMPEEGLEGVFDPNISHSGREGYFTGTYVLNVGLRYDPAPPQVIATSPAEGEVLTSPPAQLRVQFDEPINVHALALWAFAQAGESTLSAVYVSDADGQLLFPRFVSYDTATNEAVFLMLDGLPNGEFALHLSGAEGLADLAGNPLLGNDPSGDYVVRFTVNGPERPKNADGQLRFIAQEPNNGGDQVQDLGVLFPYEMDAGVFVDRLPGTATDDNADSYRFEVIQYQSYIFLVDGANLPAGMQLTLTDADGNPVLLAPEPDGIGGTTNLAPGVYEIRLDGWTPAEAAALEYEFHIWLIGVQDNPAPVATGALSAARFQLATNQPPPPPPPPGPAMPPAGEETPPTGSEPNLPPPVFGGEPPPPPAGEVPPPPPTNSGPPIPPLPLAPPGDVPQNQIPPPPPVGGGNNLSIDTQSPGLQTGFTPPAQAALTPNSLLPLGPDRPAGVTDTVPLPGPSVLLVVTLVSPSLPDTTVATTTTTLLTAGRLPDASVVPGLMTALRSGPVGGVVEVGTGLADHAQAGTNLPLPLDLLRRVTPTPSGGSVVTPGESPSDDTAVLRAWQKALELFFATQGQQDPGRPTVPDNPWQAYLPPFMHLWNEAVDALFPTTQEPVGTSTFEETEAEAEVAPDMALESAVLPDQPEEDGLLARSLAAAGGALFAFNLHRHGGRDDAKKQRRT